MLAGAVILAALVWKLGAGPFLDGLRMIDAWSLAAAVVIGLITTVCCAWRWHLVARGLGVDVPMGTAVAYYYRSQFLNMTLPGGVVGDLHRAVSHGRDVGNVSGGMRAVAWERSAGQAVQLALTIAVLLLLPSPVRSAMPLVGLSVVLIVLALLLLGRTEPESETSRWARARAVMVSDLRQGLLATSAWPGIALASAIVVTGYAATFAVAARTAGLTISTMRLLPLALLVLLAMTIPLSIGGWGLREGAAAWVFTLAGLSAAEGVSTAVVYGVLVLVASLPGAVVLTTTWLRRAPADSGGPHE
jgi:uncharacterized membrane protein YbhN (UPF0104 family)